jgi:lactoylglutathione lyase
MHAPPPQLNLVVLRSPDIERAAKFYRALGLLVTRHSHGSGPEHYVSEVSGFVFEIYPAASKSLPTTGTRIGFKVDDVDGLVLLVPQAGAEILTPATDSEWGRRAVVKGLDGHVVELITPKK